VKTSKLGRYGEELVARLLGYERQPASGAIWPMKEDLIKKEVRGGRTVYTCLAQVKTHQTVGSGKRGFLKEFLRLRNHAEARTGGRCAWFTVWVTPAKAYIFETRLVKEVDRVRIGGEE
jgi:hypothetical protein